VVYVPGAEATWTHDSSSISLREIVMAHLGKSGRAVMLPIYWGTYERGGGNGIPEGSAFVEWYARFVKDLSRAVDYLETREDLDAANVAYYGASMGAEFAISALAVERRFKVAITDAGGFNPWDQEWAHFEVDCATRVDIPILMVNGRYDWIYPYETSQKPLFEAWATPDEHKKHLVFDWGHAWGEGAQRATGEILDWLDKYQGQVRLQ